MRGAADRARHIEREIERESESERESERARAMIAGYTYAGALRFRVERPARRRSASHANRQTRRLTVRIYI